MAYSEDGVSALGVPEERGSGINELLHQHPTEAPFSQDLRADRKLPVKSRKQDQIEGRQRSGFEECKVLGNETSFSD
jgi:hypothetical protein